MTTPSQDVSDPLSGGFYSTITPPAPQTQMQFINSDSAVLPPPDPANQHYLTQSLRTQDPRDALI